MIADERLTARTETDAKEVLPFLTLLPKRAKATAKANKYNYLASHSEAWIDLCDAAKEQCQGANIADAAARDFPKGSIALHATRQRHDRYFVVAPISRHSN